MAPAPHAAPPIWLRWRARLVRHDGVLAFAAYLAVTLFWFRAVLGHMESACACGVAVDTGDNSNFVWTFEWFVHAVERGLPLLHPTVIWAPGGINLAGTTTPLLLDAIAAPLTLLWGPLPAYNVIMMLAPAASGWAANRLCRYVSRASWPAFLAGATFAFSSFEVAHLVGQLHLLVMVCPPLILLNAIRNLDGTLSDRRYVVYTSLLLIAQTLISVEILFTGTLVAALAMSVAAVIGSPVHRGRIRAKLPVLVIPWLVAGVATIWYTLEVLRAPDFAAGLAYKYPTDLLAFIVPMQYTWLGGASFPSVTGHFPGGWTETTPFLGWPMLFILGHYVVVERRTRAARILTAMFVLLAVAIVGPILYVHGRSLVRMPDALVAGLPLFTELVFGRFSIYLVLAAALALSLWLARRDSKLLGGSLGVLAVLALLPNVADPSRANVGRWTRPHFFFSREYTRYLRPGETILPIPWAYQGESMMWQAQDHMYFRMASGNLLFVPPPGWVNQLTADLWNNVSSPAPGDALALRGFMAAHHVADVVVLEPYVKSWAATLRAAGLGSGTQIGGIAIYPRASSDRWRSRTAQTEPWVAAGATTHGSFRFY